MFDPNLHIRDGVFFPNSFISDIERKIFNEMEIILENEGFQYLSIPSVVSKETYLKQGTVPWEKVFKISETHALSGSAEQGILERYQDSEVNPSLLWTKNQCFRSEPTYEGFKWLREFTKIEQFVFCHPEDWQDRFNLLIQNSRELLNRYNIKHRVIDVTTRDPGYHHKKLDIEIWTKTYGWLETHSCS